MSDGQSHASNAESRAEERAFKAYGHMTLDELEALMTAKQTEREALERQEREIVDRRRAADREAADMFRVWWAKRPTS